MSREPATPMLAEWLDTRLVDVPIALADAIRGRIAGRPGSEDDLIAAAFAGFEAVAVGTPDHDSAVELLAADALLTYAFEAAADPDLGGSADRAVRLAMAVAPGAGGPHPGADGPS